MSLKQRSATAQWQGGAQGPPGARWSNGRHRGLPAPPEPPLPATVAAAAVFYRLFLLYFYRKVNDDGERYTLPTHPSPTLNTRLSGRCVFSLDFGFSYTHTFLPSCTMYPNLTDVSSSLEKIDLCVQIRLRVCFTI